jgi:DNA-binding response OmpR family regulator
MSDSTPAIVIVDDDRACLHAMRAMLQRAGFQTHPVLDSRDAMQEIRRLKPQAVLLDIVMPHLDGYEVASQIRGDPATRDIMIIAVSSLTGEEHRLLCKALAIGRQVTKPVDPRELEIAIEVGLRGAAASTASRPTTPSEKRPLRWPAE